MWSLKSGLLVVLGCMSFAGCGVDVSSEGDVDAELRMRTPLFSSAAIAGVASIDFSAGSGAPYEANATLSGNLATVVPQLGCVPTDSQLPDGFGGYLSVGWGGGVLNQGVIQRANYAKLLPGGTVTASIDRCDAPGTPAEARLWYEIRVSSSRLKFTVIDPSGVAAAIASPTYQCIQDNCEIFEYFLPTTAPGT